MIRSRSAASATTKRARSPSLVVGEGPHREGLGAGQDAMALGQVGGGQAMHRVLAVRQREAHRLAVEHAEDALQRPHPGEVAGAPAHGFRPGEAAQHGGQPLGDQRRAPPSPRRASAAPRTGLPGSAASRVAPCLRRKPSSAASGAPMRGPRSSLPGVSARAAISPTAAIRRGPYSGRGACGHQRRERLQQRPRTAPPPPAPACAPGFPRRRARSAIRAWARARPLRRSWRSRRP